MKIITMVLGYLETNCYLLIDEASKQAAVIDPADDAARIAGKLEAEGVTLRYILLTHGHRDHTKDAPALHQRFPEAAVFIHEKDKNGSGNFHYALDEKIPALRFYDDGDTLPLGDLSIRVMTTPGHTAGSVVLLCGNALFAGDTLFAGSIGRIDLPGAEPEKMFPSLRRLAGLPGDYDVYPGHGEATTLERERQRNLFLRQVMP